MLRGSCSFGLNIVVSRWQHIVNEDIFFVSKTWGGGERESWDAINK